MAHEHAAATSIGEVAVIVSTADNVAVVKTAVEAGLALERPDGHIVTLTGAVTPGHRFATRPIPEGEFVLQYGQPIGTSMGIAEGDPITVRNMSNDVPVVRDLPADLHTPAPEYFAESERATWRGYRRADGRVGTRNFVLIVPTSMCASHESQQIATLAEYTLYSREKFPNVDGVVAIPHNKGCGCSDGSNIEVMLRTLSNYAAHPNVGGVIFIGLGCEKTNLTAVEKVPPERAPGSRQASRPLRHPGRRRHRGRHRAWPEGSRRDAPARQRGDAHRREDVRADSRREVRRLGWVLRSVGEPIAGPRGQSAGALRRHRPHHRGPEFCGAEHILAQRARDRKTGEDVYQMVDWSPGTPRSSGRC